MSLHPIWLTSDAPPEAFPDVDYALSEPQGLLAVGGDLSPARLLAAYRRGIFPWYSEGQPILWWSPDPRAVFEPGGVLVSRSLRKRLRSARFTVTLDRAFDAVVRGCAAPRAQQPGTWITEEMADAYGRLHRLGHAHSVEVWRDGALVGGLYGVAIGRAFFGESMFSRETDASKVALVHLEALGFGLIDCQVPNRHLAGLGAILVRRRAFCARIAGLTREPGPALVPGPLTVTA